MLPPNSAKFVLIDWNFDFIQFYIELEYVMFSNKTDEADGEISALMFELPPMEITWWNDFDYVNEHYTIINGKLWSPLPNYRNFNILWVVIIQKSLISFTSIEGQSCSISFFQSSHCAAA